MVKIIALGTLEIMDDNPESIPWRFTKEYGYQYYNCIKKKWFPLVFENK